MNNDQKILRSLEGRTTPAEEVDLARWRAASEQNERRYHEVAGVWRVLGGAEANNECADRPTASAIIARADEVRSASVIPHPAIREVQPRRDLGSLGKVAAIIIGVGLIGFWWSARAVGPEFAVTELTTGVSEMVTTRLSDGTTVRLAPESRLLMRSPPNSREVWLDGQAFFAVAHDDRPFTVRTRIGDAVVLGTRFDILVNDHQVRVAVVEGRVALTAQGQRVEAGAGEVGRAAEGVPPVVEREENLNPMLAWMDGLLVFQDTPLPAALAELEKRFGIRTLVVDSALNERTVSAWLDVDDPEEGLAIVCRVVGARCTLRDSVAILEP